MKVWLLHIGEELPVDGGGRPFRYGYLARALEERGHQVLRWAPTFRHATKTQRFSTDRREQVSRNYAIQFVHAPGYCRNVGLERLRTYRVLGRRFREIAGREPPPDIIVAAIPSLEWAAGAAEYGRAHRVPVVIDVRDLWPDVFLNALPTAARRAGRLALVPYYRLARRACRQADAIAAVSQSYLDWALRLACRTQQPRDMVAPLGFELDPAPVDLLRDSLAVLRSRGINPALPTCLFAGLFERSYDVETVVEAARRLDASGRTDLQFILCGDGAKMPTVRRRARELLNVHLLGWVDAPMLEAARSISSIGLCAYAADATQSLPNKPFEYMAGRLAIVSSLPGEMPDLLQRHQCGVTYRAGDAHSLARCLVELAAAPKRLAAMRENAYQAWSKNYRSRDIYSRFVDHLTTLTAAAAKAA
jgi:glycosyltransferase involved in cell wall biosynthesis